MKRVLKVLVLGVVLTLIASSVAWAHTTVSPGQAAAGGSQTYTVNAPGEKDVPIVGGGVEVPDGFEVTEVPRTPGWESEMEDGSLVWKGGKIAGGEEQEFTFVARAPQEPGEYKFSTSDTYEDGSVSEWAGAEDSESPASFVEVVAEGESAGASGRDDDHGSGASGDLPETGGISPALLYGVFGAGALGIIIALLATPALLRRRS